MPRFVLLYHECPSNVPRPSHWDFMLEQDCALRTWVLSELPLAWRTAGESDCVSAEEIQPHRLDYLDLEGPLTGGRGRVSRIERGTFEVIESSEVHLRVRLSGRRISGMAELRRSDASTTQWRLATGPATTAG